MKINNLTTLLILFYIFMPINQNLTKKNTSNKNITYHTSSVPEGAIVVAATPTPISREVAKAALQSAMNKLIVPLPSAKSVALLTAQWAIETGNGDKMMNYNFGGIKGMSTESKKTTLYKTTEGYGEEKQHIDDYFRAYDSVNEGALDYVQLLSNKLGSKIEYLIDGDVDNFVQALKESKYFTGNPAQYKSNMRSISGSIISKEEKEKEEARKKGKTKKQAEYAINLANTFYKKSMY